MANPWQERRASLEALWIESPVARLPDVFKDGRPGYQAWTKIKNPTYWRRDTELALMQRRRERVASPR